MFMDMLLMPLLLVIVKSSVEAAEKAQWFENYKIGIFIVFVYKIFGTKIQLILARNMLQIIFAFIFRVCIHCVFLYINVSNLLRRAWLII